MYYTSFDSAVAMVRGCGKGALMGKCDVKSTFQLLPVHPADFDLLGFQLGGSIFVDMALPMAVLFLVPRLARLSSGLPTKGIHAKRGHYLDDFFVCG